jgi:hypothetical protein
MHHLHRLKADLLPCLFPENYRAAQHFVVELQRNDSYGIGYIIGDVGDGVRAVSMWRSSGRPLSSCFRDPLRLLMANLDGAARVRRQCHCFAIRNL